MSAGIRALKSHGQRLVRVQARETARPGPVTNRRPLLNSSFVGLVLGAKGSRSRLSWPQERAQLGKIKYRYVVCHTVLGRMRRTCYLTGLSLREEEKKRRPRACFPKVCPQLTFDVFVSFIMVSSPQIPLPYLSIFSLYVDILRPIAP